MISEGVCCASVPQHGVRQPGGLQKSGGWDARVAWDVLILTVSGDGAVRGQLCALGMKLTQGRTWGAQCGR